MNNFAIVQESFFVLSILLLMGCVGWSARAKAQKRASELSIAGEMLEEHYAHLEKFMADPGAPEVLKDALMQFSDGAADKEVAISVAKEVARDRERGHNRLPDDDATVVALKALAAHRPDLAEAFYKSVAAGIAAMYLRWPEAAKFRDIMMARVATHASEVSFATRTAKRHDHNHDHNGDANFGGGLAHA